MYIPAAFAPDDAVVRELLSRPPAADLITMTEDGMVATFLPFVFDPDVGEHGVLRVHDDPRCPETST